jgi:hydroxypyruvate isomerase
LYGSSKLGIKGIDLVGPEEWPILKKYGLDSPMCNGAEINLIALMILNFMIH